MYDQKLSVVPGAAPVARLKRRGIVLFCVAVASLAFMAATGLAQIAVVLLRDGELAGLMNGGFAFVVPSWYGEALPAAFVPISAFVVWQSNLAAGLLTLRLLPGLVLIGCLTALFRSYARGIVFSAPNERQLRSIAWALVAYAIVPLITHAALYGAGMSPVAVKLEWPQLEAVVLGILLFAFVDVVAFGAEIDRDRAGFV